MPHARSAAGGRRAASPRVCDPDQRASIARDLPLLQLLAARTSLRVSFSITTDREDIRRIFEPHCAPIE